MISSVVFVGLCAIVFAFGVYLTIEQFDIAVCVMTVSVFAILLAITAETYVNGFNAYRSVCPECGYVCTDEEFTNCPKDGHELIVAWKGEKDE